MLCRSAIGAAIEVDHTLARQGLFAWLKLRFAGQFRVEPCAPPGLPSPYLASAVAGLGNVARGRPPGGLPVIATGAVLLDGAWHERDSMPRTFAATARAAFGEAMTQAGRRLARRYDRRPRDRGARMIVTALVPLVDLPGYGGNLAELA